jgi:hypothetical protein
LIFPAQENGWEKRQPARGLDPMHVREVVLRLASNTGLLEATKQDQNQQAA